MYLVSDEVGWVIGVGVLKEKILIDRSRDHGGLEPSQALESYVARGDSPHSHGVREIDIFRRRLLGKVCGQTG